MDPKDRHQGEAANASVHPRIYVPHSDHLALNYYIHIAATRPHLRLEVVRLPETITPAYVKSINDKPGILSLALRTEWDPREKSNCLRGNPFIVPGGRFNEMYGWDSYFEVLGLLCDGFVDISKSMVENFVYQIHHYGKILNANRTYYLTRSQPPFLTDMILVVYERMAKDGFVVFGGSEEKAKRWLRLCFCAAIKEYKTVWMAEPRFVPQTGLSRFYGQGLGMPPETEQSHFNVILAPFAEKRGLDIQTFSVLYNNGTIQEPELDAYFMHDRAVRESGHDTTYRLEGRCAFLNPVDLNCLLYQYELDIGRVIRDYFDDSFEYDPLFCKHLMDMIIDSTASTYSHVMEEEVIESAASELEALNISNCCTKYTDKSLNYYQAAERRRESMERYLWNEEIGMYFDYDFETGTQTAYESMNGVFYPLWCGIIAHGSERVDRMVKIGLEKFEVAVSSILPNSYFYIYI